MLMNRIPEIYHFTDDGIIPNSRHPVLVFRQVFNLDPDLGADWLEGHFAENGWTNAFRWRVYDYHHYHSNTHEVLGVYAGNASLQLGGEHGQQLQVGIGDVVILPAGTGHKSVSHSKDFAIVGAYPDGKEPDLIRLEDERPKDVREKVDTVPLPENDPLSGKSSEGLLNFWK
ncbi:Uncharacterized protein YjlB [Pedobacter nyackensis]|uniref:Uncharacterized protein YjlB n=2 Tax=Pedobacter nyackensis TaxID=475255 RepID=A0A1W2ELA3_9SPHI|nr:Uncharacterized protein YjlB [Pedobacter nyackensis]